MRRLGANSPLDTGVSVSVTPQIESKLDFRIETLKAVPDLPIVAPITLATIKNPERPEGRPAASQRPVTRSQAQKGTACAMKQEFAMSEDEKVGVLRMQPSERWAVCRPGHDPVEITSGDVFRLEVDGVLRVTRMEYLRAEGYYSIDGFDLHDDSLNFQ
jgi:hypothetical protein